MSLLGRIQTARWTKLRQSRSPAALLPTFRAATAAIGAAGKLNDRSRLPEKPLDEGLTSSSSPQAQSSIMISPKSSSRSEFHTPSPCRVPRGASSPGRLGDAFVQLI